MTQKEKINMLRDTIAFLYEKEGRSKSYISKLLNVDRKTLLQEIENWKLTQANISYLTPSNQKFANKHKQLIKSRLDQDVSVVQIANEIGVTRYYLKNIIDKVPMLSLAKSDYDKRKQKRHEQINSEAMKSSSRQYDFTDLADEEWKEILGYPSYYISNYGRVKKYAKRYKKYYLLTPTANTRSGRLYVKIANKGLQISRLVGFAFIDGYSETQNTIDHIDGNIANNKWTNLRWVSQSENNSAAYLNGKLPVKAYSKHKKFKAIRLNDMYEFKTITALARFLNVSETQAQRYISGESKSDKYKITFIY